MQPQGKRRIRDFIADWYWIPQLLLVAGFLVLLLVVKPPQIVLWLYLLIYVLIMRPVRKEVWRRFRESRRRRAGERSH